MGLIIGLGNSVGGKGGGSALIPITYIELKTKRDNKLLIPGTKYRITDYTCEIKETEEIISAHNLFDIIVTALTESTLDEYAKAALHEGDTYFDNQCLEAWELKYNLDNKGEYGKQEGYIASLNLIIEGLTLHYDDIPVHLNDTTVSGFPYKLILFVEGVGDVNLYLNSIDTSTPSVMIEAMSPEGPIILPLEDAGGSLEDLECSLVEGGNGYISWMKDDKNNQAHYDFKNILYARYIIMQPFSLPIAAFTYKFDDLKISVTESNKDFYYTFSTISSLLDRDITDASLLKTTEGNYIDEVSFNNVIISAASFGIIINAKNCSFINSQYNSFFPSVENTSVLSEQSTGYLKCINSYYNSILALNHICIRTDKKLYIKLSSEEVIYDLTNTPTVLFTTVTKPTILLDGVSQSAVLIFNNFTDTSASLKLSYYDNSIFNFSTLDSLTIQNYLPENNTQGIVINFTSGATATTLSVPANSKWRGTEVPTIEANKTYSLIIIDHTFSLTEITTAS